MAKKIVGNAAPVNLNSIIAHMGRDKGIEPGVIREALEAAILSAAKKQFGHNLNLETQYDEDFGTVEVVEFKTVVEQVEDPSTEINLEDAKSQYDVDAQIGDELGRKLSTENLGRIAAQTAKQVIMQKVRDAERDIIYLEYKDRKGELVNGIVQRYERGSLIVNLGRTEALLPRREQILRERYRQGDRIRGMILDVDPSSRGPQVILTRSHPDLLIKLFELEVPEISEGLIEIKAAAREPGDRAKIAVYSTDSNIDPVGACVGVKGSRVQAVVQELRGERIDIVVWTNDAPSFVARALSPAEVSKVLVNEDEQKMEVIVPDEQLSLAIGRRGQNVKLASKLTGWRIDVRSISLIEEEAKRARVALESIPGLDMTLVELMYQEGYRTVRDVADASAEDLAEIDGIEVDQAKELITSATTLVEASAGEDDEDQQEPAPITDLDKLSIPENIRQRLISTGFTAIQSLAVSDWDDVKIRAGLSEEDLERVREATDLFLKSRPADRISIV